MRAVGDDALSTDARDGALLTLDEAADRLKVHYMTAYRWVRRGRLPAYKAGGRLRVRAADVEEFLAQREVEVGLPSDAAGRTDWPLHVERLHRALRAGDAIEAQAIVRKVVSDGAPAGAVYLELFTPALSRIGDDWAAGDATISAEHRATHIVRVIMSTLGDAFRRRGPRRGVAVTCTPPDEQHDVGCAMAADFLRGAGWEVHHLGASVPLDDLAMFLEAVPADAVCVSFTAPPTAGALQALRRAVGERALVVGGGGIRPDDAQAVDAMLVARLADLPATLAAARVDEDGAARDRGGRGRSRPGAQQHAADDDGDRAEDEVRDAR